LEVEGKATSKSRTKKKPSKPRAFREKPDNFRKMSFKRVVSSDIVNNSS